MVALNAVCPIRPLTKVAPAIKLRQSEQELAVGYSPNKSISIELFGAQVGFARRAVDHLPKE